MAGGAGWLRASRIGGQSRRPCVRTYADSRSCTACQRGNSGVGSTGGCEVRTIINTTEAILHFVEHLDLARWLNNVLFFQSLVQYVMACIEAKSQESGDKEP